MQELVLKSWYKLNSSNKLKGSTLNSFLNSLPNPFLQDFYTWLKQHSQTNFLLNISRILNLSFFQDNKCEILFFLNAYNVTKEVSKRKHILLYLRDFANNFRSKVYNLPHACLLKYVKLFSLKTKTGSQIDWLSQSTHHKKKYLIYVSTEHVKKAKSTTNPNHQFLK